ncbi:MAG: glycosyltransferase family 4 protein [Hydrogenobacter thermophilus]|uniref:glycosyltransferase family 4 protein n=1 Tax=Hydrogenobacter thermophilus TaxID=940 RepID=UPI001C7955AA|nr:glycosyltransferase family 4 protein [Hydrogenobacter thermophilus]QWK19155.1 MAG: glycosyltransferase family 4 protein [Hydrogenobacter thermophilus]
MKVLFLNRRCIKHPQRGGAEVYTMELARAVVERGGVAEWFSSRAKGLESEEVIDGVRFIRRGNELTTHFYGFFYALKKDKDWIIVDEFNGVGFFTFFLKNSVLLIHQLYQELWTAEFGIWGHVFKVLEKLLLKFYKNKPTITVSDSTYQDLVSLGFKRIRIVPNGLNVIPLSSVPEKEETLHLVYLGRLKRTKNPEDAIKAFMLVKEKVKDAKLVLMGDGPMRTYLTRRYSDVEGLTFLGYVERELKHHTLERSHILLVPSIREGWGQVVIEANAFGTPAIGYRVHGLKDSIKHAQTGFLVKDYREMAQKVIQLWEDRELYHQIARNCLDWAKNFSWERTKREFLKLLESMA